MRTVLATFCIFWMFAAGAPISATLPPRCFPVAEILPPEPTYVPNEPFTLEFRPVAGDWPSTPTFFSWRVIDNPSTLGEQEQVFEFPDSYPDFVYVSVRSQGPDPECGNWTTSTYSTTVRRFDATPSPTATPFPTTPIETPCPVPCRISYPRGFQSDVPLSFHILTTPPTAPSFLAPSSGGPGVPIQFVEPGKWWVEGLQPGTQYALQVYCGEDCRGNGISGILPFTTVSQTPSPTPTTATPSPTTTGTTSTLTVTPTAASPTATSTPTTATLTVTPTASLPTPTPADTPRGDGWILSSMEYPNPPEVNAGNAWNDPNCVSNWPLTSIRPNRHNHTG